MTFRQLMVWMNAYALTVDDKALDMKVILRVEDLNGDDVDMVVGELGEINVDSGHTEVDALVLDGGPPDEAESEEQ